MRTTYVEKRRFNEIDDAFAFEAGDVLVVLGGTEADPCPPAADCSLPDEPPAINPELKSVPEPTSDSSDAPVFFST